MLPGLLLLCDVALGKMYERTKADYIGEIWSRLEIGLFLKRAPDIGSKCQYPTIRIILREYNVMYRIFHSK